MSHTPEPWDYDGGPSCEITAPTTHVNAHGHGCAQLVAVATLDADLNDGEDGIPQRPEEEAVANAEFIVRAVNNYQPLIRALESAELSCTRARLANGIGRTSKAHQISFLLGSFERLAKEARAAIEEARK